VTGTSGQDSGLRIQELGLGTNDAETSGTNPSTGPAPREHLLPSQQIRNAWEKKKGLPRRVPRPLVGPPTLSHIVYRRFFVTT
jgi:hypothetical protein